MKDRVEDKPAIEKLEDSPRQDIIAAFREWLDKPETKIEGVERFWEYKARILLSEIDSLRDKLKEAEKQLNIETDLHGSMQSSLVDQHIEEEEKLKAQLVAIIPPHTCGDRYFGISGCERCIAERALDAAIRKRGASRRGKDE